MKKEILENFKFIVIAYGAIIGFLIFILIMDGISNSDHEIWQSFNDLYSNSLLMIGIVIAGISFADFRTKERTITYLLLPASSLEKTIANILLSTLGVVISYTIVFFFSQFIFILIGKIFFSFQIGSFNPFNLDILNKIYLMFVIQSIFLAGSSYFKKMPFFKTSLFVSIIWIVFFMLSAILISSLVFDAKDAVGLRINYGIQYSYINFSPDKNLIDSDMLITSKILNIFFNYLLMPVFFIATYFNVKEKEV